MATLNLKTKVTLDGVFADTGAVSGVDPSVVVAYQAARNLTNGTGNDQGNELFTDSQSLAATSITYDLEDGTLFNEFGDAITFSAIKMILIVNKATSAGFDLTVDGNWIEGEIITGTTPNIVIPPQGIHLSTNIRAGWAVAAATADLLKIDAGGSNTVAFDLFLAGVT